MLLPRSRAGVRSPRSVVDAELKSRWLAALRSGEYKQGRGALRVGDKYCCLGVLCNLYDSSCWVESEQAKSSEQPPLYVYMLDEHGDVAFLPDTVAIAASLFKVQAELTERNDNGETFAQIADFIEENL